LDRAPAAPVTHPERSRRAMMWKPCGGPGRRATYRPRCWHPPVCRGLAPPVRSTPPNPCWGGSATRPAGSIVVDEASQGPANLRRL